MGYKIDPCKAIGEKLRDADCDINTMNSLCYGIAKAYGDAYGPELEYKLKKQCQALISDKKCTLGYDNCYMRRPTPPPIWNQVPHYFPVLFKDCEDVDTAYKKCVSMCGNSNNNIECMENCKLEADSVVKSSDIEHYDETYKQKDSGNCGKSDDEPDYEGYKDAHPFVFFMGFGIVVVMIILLVVYFIRGLLTKK